MNNYLLDKNSKVILSLIFLLSSLALFYVFFLLMSVSYTYAAKNDSSKLNILISQSVEKKIELFERQRDIEEKLLTKKFVKLDKINYVKTSDVLVAKIIR